VRLPQFHETKPKAVSLITRDRTVQYVLPGVFEIPNLLVSDVTKK
jgi:hypothetical protein